MLVVETATKHVHLLTNSLDRKQTSTLKKAVKQLKGSIGTKTTEIFMATHFVVGTTSNQASENIAKSRNRKQQEAMLHGKWIVSFQWIVDSMKAGKWIDEEPYEIHGDAKAASIIPGGPKRARLQCIKNKSSSIGRSIFTNVHFYVGKNTKLSPNHSEYLHLLRVGHGTVWTNAPLSESLKRLENDLEEGGGVDEQGIQNILICDRIERCAQSFIEQSKLIAVTEEWASDSISNFQLMDTSDYIVKSRRRM
jgi:hypothetical protein